MFLVYDTEYMIEKIHWVFGGSLKCHWPAPLLLFGQRKHLIFLCLLTVAAVTVYVS